MDVDAVYTWVNHRDPCWLEWHNQAVENSDDDEAQHETSNSSARFQSRDELYYSIQSIKKYAPWIRKIYVVTNCALALNILEEPKVCRVGHEDIFPDPKVLPVFNSRAIEANLHHIEGLSEKFLYVNDDFFFCRPVEKSDFFLEDGKVLVFPTAVDMPYDKPEPLSPFEHGALNACRLVLEETGYKPAKKLHHAPYPLSRKTLFEIESKYSDLIAATRGKKFRHKDDIPLATSMHAYYSIAHGKGEIRNIRSRYVDIGDPLFLLLVHRLSPLRRGRYMFCCLNEVTEMRNFAGLRDRVVVRLMRKMFSN